MPSLELKGVSQVSASLGAAATNTIEVNLDAGVIRMKSLHMDMVFSPDSAATGPVVVDVCLHRHHNDLTSGNLNDDEGATRVKYERLTVGRGTDRYYRMWLKEINLENGQELTLMIRPIDITLGTPSYGLGAKWWQFVSTDS